MRAMRITLLLLLVPVFAQSAEPPPAPNVRLKALEQACAGGSGSACLDLAESGGAGALSYSAKACELGLSRGCDLLVESAQKNNELATVVTAHTATCNAGSPSGCYLMGTALVLQGDRTKAEDLFKIMCGNSIAFGCSGLGTLFRLDKKRPEAAELLTKACRMGDPSGCLIAGVILAESRGVAEDPETVGLWTEACERGLSQGCVRAAASALKKNLPEVAKKLFHEGCSLHSLESCVRVGMLNYASAELLDAEWAFTYGCTDLHAESCYYLGLIQAAKLKDPNPFFIEAMGLAKKSCENGYKEDCKVYESAQIKSEISWFGRVLIALKYWTNYLTSQ